MASRQVSEEEIARETEAEGKREKETPGEEQIQEEDKNFCSPAPTASAPDHIP